MTNVRAFPGISKPQSNETAAEFIQRMIEELKNSDGLLLKAEHIHLSVMTPNGDGTVSYRSFMNNMSLKDQLWLIEQVKRNILEQ